MKRKLLALLLAALLVLNLFGCQSKPAEDQTETTDPVQEELPPEPSATEVYGDAAKALGEKTSVTLDITEKTSITAGHQHVTDTESSHTLTYASLDTEAPLVLYEENVDYTNFSTEVAEDEEDIRLYTEIYADGKLYIELQDVAAFQGEMTAEDVKARYIPVVLFDASLYGDISVTSSGSTKTVSFAAPTAAESWALPETAELIDATGSAVIGADGTITQMNYNITYKYGSSEITWEIESKPRTETLTVEAPQNPYRFNAISSVDAVWISLFATNELLKAETFSMYSAETSASYAGGVVLAQFTDTDLYTGDGKPILSADTTMHIYEASGQTTIKQEQTIIDGKLTSVTDGGLPTTQSGITDDILYDASRAGIMLNMTPPGNWQDATIEDLGSVYFLEFTYDEDLANTFQNAICTMFWNDPAMLNNLATAYETKEMSGYLAIDKYTRMVTAFGLYYEGVHTIEGDEYILSMQIDQSFQFPSFGAYEAITEEPLPETEPENKATPLLYHVTGENGQEMWLFGTIHVGDSRTAFLPQEVYDAFNASDALALEFDSDAFEQQLEEDDAMAEKYSNTLFYSNGKTLEEVMEEEDYARAVKLMKASGNYSDNMLYAKPYIWENSITNFYLEQGHYLTSEQGLESRFTHMAHEQGKPIYEVESGMFQISMVTGWSEELQLLLLDDALYSDPVEYMTDTAELYELWCSGDEEALRIEINDDEEVDTSEFTEEELEEYNAALPYLDEYDKAMLFDRNAGMLDVAISYLESGEVVFYAVGLAHLLDNENGLVDTLRQAGYTVEVVVYN